MSIPRFFEKRYGFGEKEKENSKNTCETAIYLV
jgi:hypothetical protein